MIKGSKYLSGTRKPKVIWAVYYPNNPGNTDFFFTKKEAEDYILNFQLIRWKKAKLEKFVRE